MSEKRDNFKRISARRMGDLLKGLKLIGNLSSANYEWAPVEIDELFEQLATAMRGSHARFKKRGGWPEAPPVTVVTSKPNDAELLDQQQHMQETIDLQRKVIDTMQIRLTAYRDKFGSKV